MLNRSVTVIWNDNAGSAERYEFLRDDLSFCENVTLLLPQSGDEARQMAANAGNRQQEVVVAAGGDGTINDVAQGLLDVGGTATLGAIPLGTGNDFCRNAGIPLDPLEAVRLLDSMQTRPTDVIQVETSHGISHYINMATGGNTGLYTDLITDDMKQFWGPLVYVRGAVDVLSNLQVYHATIAVDQEPSMDVEALNVFVANGCGSGGGLPVAPDAEVDDGLLDLIVVQDGTALEIAGIARDYAISDYLENEHIIHRRAAEVTISSKPRLVFSTDGDVLDDVSAEVPVRFTVQTHALQVIRG